MTNIKQQKQDAANSVLNALGTGTPGESLLKRLRSLSAHNPDVAGVIAFVERAAKIEHELGVARQELAQARRFDMRNAGVRLADLPDVSYAHAGDVLTPNAGDPWAKYERLKAKDAVAAQDFYDKHLRVHGRKE